MPERGVSRWGMASAYSTLSARAVTKAISKLSLGKTRHLVFFLGVEQSVIDDIAGRKEEEAYQKAQLTHV